MKQITNKNIKDWLEDMTHLFVVPFGELDGEKTNDLTDFCKRFAARSLVKAIGIEPPSRSSNNPTMFIEYELPWQENSTTRVVEHKCAVVALSKWCDDNHLEIRRAIEQEHRRFDFTFKPYSHSSKSRSNSLVIQVRKSPVLRREYNGKRLEEWIKVYLKGMLFCDTLRRDPASKHVLIEYLYVKPRNYSEILSTLGLRNSRIIYLVGPPKSGKTYTALHLLYEQFVSGKADVKYFESVNSLRRFIEARPKHSEDSKMNQPIVAYIDDPFGDTSFDAEGTTEFLGVVGEIERSAAYIEVIVTSRTEVYAKARRSQKQLPSFDCNEVFDFGPIGSSESLYSCSQLEDVFERMAWLANVKWLNDYRLARQPKISADIEPWAREWIEMWDPARVKDLLPGSINSTFVLYPSIRNLDGRNVSDVGNLRLYLERHEDLTLAFSSEVRTAVFTGESAILWLYAFLGAMTLLTDQTYGSVFPESELRELEEYRLYDRQKSGQPFALTGHVYVHPGLAEAVSKVLYGAQSRIIFTGYGDNKGILDLLAERLRTFNLFPARVVADVVCTFLSIHGRDHGRAPIGEILKHLRMRGDDAEARWITIVSCLFRSPGANIEDAVKAAIVGLVGIDPREVSQFASLIDQCLCRHHQHLDEGQAQASVELLMTPPIKYLTEILQIFFRELLSSSGGNHISMSVMLHAVLSHIEHWIGPERITPTDLRTLIGAVWVQQLFTGHTLLGTSRREWTVVWLDAIVMKIGELNYYTAKDMYLSDASPQSVKNVASLYSPAKDVLDTLLDVLEEVLEEILRIPDEDECIFLSGALAFTLVWHDRWAFIGSTALSERLLRIQAKLGRAPKVRTVNWGKPGGVEEGIIFNITYHTDYFLTKSPAWQREVSIYLWHRLHPRVGADELFETGLHQHELMEGVDSRRFFEELADGLSLAVSGSCSGNSKWNPTQITAIVFVLGIRARRHRALRERLRTILIDSLSNSKFHLPVWVGACHLVQNNLGAAIVDVIHADTRPEIQVPIVEDIIARIEQMIAELNEADAYVLMPVLDFLRSCAGVDANN